MDLRSKPSTSTMRATLFTMPSTTPKPGTAVFLSDPAQPGPQYRLSYTFLDGVMSGQFELKMPGQTEFTSYLEWSGKRQ